MNPAQMLLGLISVSLIFSGFVYFSNNQAQMRRCVGKLESANLEKVQDGGNYCS